MMNITLLYMPILMAAVGFFAGYSQEGLQAGIIYAIGFFSGSFIYRYMRYYIVDHTKKISSRQR
ncbi:hypothetical protein ACJROX_02470 [Pseudalkalibacillus sp. A8]|uniref:hypothetical protein n=1 Tax=Pseudalkalibacillus sp. A8 TaxID=3382641 RepID=UPI0038B653EE